MTQQRRLLPWALALAVVLPTSAAAQRCPAPQTLLGEVDGHERLRFLRERLHANARAERRDLIGWSATNLGLAALSPLKLVISTGPSTPAEDRGARIEILWSAATSVAGTLLSMIQPLPLILQERRLGQKGGAVCAQVAEAEAALRRAAASQEGARGVTAHVSSLLINVGLGLVLAYALGRDSGAGTNTTIGILLGEMKIATRPQLAVQALQRYQTGDLSVPPPPPSWFPFSLTLAPLSAGGVHGVALVGLF